MTRNRSRVLAVLATAFAVVLSTVVALGAAEPASAKGVNPSWNIPIRGKNAATWYFRDSGCVGHAAGRRCEKNMIAALNHARKRLGKPAYKLPRRFGKLSSAEQLLVLVNDDRHAYRLPLVRGLNTQLNKAARAGAKRNADPSPYGRAWTGYAANWAGGMGSPLFAYYGWMYADGLNHDGTSTNIDCSTSHRSGCWGHRDNVLHGFGRGSKLALGIGYARTAFGASWAQLFQAYPASHKIGFVPTVTGLTARSGPVAGKGTLRISGYGFYRVKLVRFGTAKAKITHRSAKHLTVAVPRHRAGGVHVIVVTAGGSSSQNAASAYRYR
jgi:hypothetical protein